MYCDANHMSRNQGLIVISSHSQHWLSMEKIHPGIELQLGRGVYSGKEMDRLLHSTLGCL